MVVRIMFAPAPESWLRGLSFATSLTLHCAVVALVATMSSSTTAHQIPPEAESQTVIEKKYRIIWFLKGERLPVIDSGESRTVRLPAAPTPTKHVIFTSPKREPNHKQFILTDPPRIANQPEIPSPNLISLAAPPSRPAPLPPRPEPKHFQPPESKRKLPGSPAEIPIPELAATSKAQLPLPPAVDSAAIPKLTRPPALKFIPPAGGGSRGASGQQALIDAPPTLSANGRGSGIGSDAKTLAIISATPASLPPPPTPHGKRDDSVQIGGTPGGLPNGEGGTGGAAIPGLTVRGGENRANGGAAVPASPPPPTAAAATATPTRLSPLPPPISTPAVSVPQWPNARRVPPTVDAAFPDRPVYTTVLSAPSGLPDWVLWFSESTPTAPGVRVFMRPPVPRQMAWADTPNLLPGGLQKIWVKGHLTREGIMVSISVDQGGSSAAVAIAQILGRWLFLPAVRNGQAIDADVLLEMILSRNR